MKIRVLSMFAIASIVFAVSCKKDPQQYAEEKAEKAEQQTEMHADRAEDHAEKSMGAASQALETQTVQQLNEAIAGVQVPQLSSNAANELVGKIGRDAVDFVNSKNYQEAGKYIDKVNADLATLQKKEENGGISAEDAAQIRDYASAVAQSLGLSL